jgi:ribonuclease HII
MTSMNKTEERTQKKEQKLQEELQRIYQLSEYERQYRQVEFIAGVDEVGRGPIAGPVVAAAVILPKDCEILYINDSKKLSKKKRESIYHEIVEKAIATGLGLVSSERIDEINILQGTYEAMRMAVENLSVSPDLLLVDAVIIPGLDIRQVSIIKGDTKSISIAAASIFAKVTRDRIMAEYDKRWPGYDFAKNSGYGTKSHLEAVQKLGLTPIHRRTFIRDNADSIKESK